MFLFFYKANSVLVVCNGFMIVGCCVHSSKHSRCPLGGAALHTLEGVEEIHVTCC